MGKKGWWRQIQSGEYPETKTDYGQSLEALEGERPNRTPDAYEKRSLQENCKKCGRLYWIDKGCTFCGQTDREDHQKIKSKPHAKKLSRKSMVQRTVYCPKCGSKMVLRTARKGKYAGQEFWGCSKYPNCNAVSTYYDF